MASKKNDPKDSPKKAPDRTGPSATEAEDLDEASLVSPQEFLAGVLYSSQHEAEYRDIRVRRSSQEFLEQLIAQRSSGRYFGAKSVEEITRFLDDNLSNRTEYQSVLLGRQVLALVEEHGAKGGSLRGYTKHPHPLGYIPSVKQRLGPVGKFWCKTWRALMGASLPLFEQEAVATAFLETSCRRPNGGLEWVAEKILGEESAQFLGALLRATSLDAEDPLRQTALSFLLSASRPGLPAVGYGYLTIGQELVHRSLFPEAQVLLSWAGQQCLLANWRARSYELLQVVSVQVEALNASPDLSHLTPFSLPSLSRRMGLEVVWPEVNGLEVANREIQVFAGGGRGLAVKPDHLVLVVTELDGSGRSWRLEWEERAQKSDSPDGDDVPEDETGKIGAQIPIVWFLGAVLRKALETGADHVFHGDLVALPVGKLDHLKRRKTVKESGKIVAFEVVEHADVASSFNQLRRSAKDRGLSDPALVKRIGRGENARYFVNARRVRLAGTIEQAPPASPAVQVTASES